MTRSIITAAIVAITAGTASADIWSSGDLGNNVIHDAGSYSMQAEIPAVSVTAPAQLDVRYGLWNSPDVYVDVYVNGTLVGDFVADRGYISPGPLDVSYDITGLLVNGTNTILFTGNDVNSGDYVVGQGDILYTVPAPGTVALAGIGGLMLAKRRRG